MKFSVETAHGRTRIGTLAGEFDGTPPVPYLEIGLNLQSILGPDRLAVGLALIYSPWLAGPLHTPEPVSALTAQRLCEFFGDRFVAVATVTDRALPIPRGVDTVTVDDSISSQHADATGPSITLAPFSQREGSVSDGQHLTVASNIHLFALPTPSLIPPGLHTLGLAVLLAEHADANVLIHRAADSGSPVLDRLMECVGLGLSSP